MNPVCTPGSPEETAELLRDAAARSKRISVCGNSSKRSMGGPCLASDVAISTVKLSRILQYEPNDLTVSVEAGMRWSELQKRLAQQRQMIALDPPFFSEATVGGVIASNSSGSLRARFGTARDLVIGMQFATLEGKLIRTGGMVVKNVAGLDIAKLMIGSFGTLAAITSANFRLHPLPEETRTFLYSFTEAETAIERRTALQQTALRPLAYDLIGPVVAARLGYRGYLLAIRAAGSARLLNRYAQELSGSDHLTGTAEHSFWEQVREFPAEYLRRHPGGLSIRVGTPLTDIGRLLRLASGASITRASVGVSELYLSGWGSVNAMWGAIRERGWSAAVACASDEARTSRELWLMHQRDESGFAMMKSVKQMFDPGNLLNRSRLYGRI